MGLNLCPAATVAAPVEDVWELLTRPERYEAWYDAHTERIVPEGPATAGQTVYASSPAFGGRWLRLHFPLGWKGWLLEHLGVKVFERNVEDSLARLKPAAESLYKSKEAV